MLYTILLTEYLFNGNMFTVLLNIIRNRNEEMIVTFFLEVIGTVTFAFSGAYVAINYDLDWLGIILMACTTACGGGMTRDVILDNTPPSLFRNPVYILMAVAVAFITIFCYEFLVKSTNREKILFIINTLDAVGLAIFTVVGMQVAINCGYKDNTFLVCFCGVLSAVGGGLLRDIMVNRTPVVLSKEIYATAAIPGAILYYYAPPYIGEFASITLSLILIFGIRMWSIIKNKNLPVVEKLTTD